MIIDFHTHVGDLRPAGREDLLPVSWESLIRRLDEQGIDRAVFLPLGVSPEMLQGPFLFASQTDLMSQLREARRRRRRSRIIPFGNLDPRMCCLGNLEAPQVTARPQPDFSWILDRLVGLGCAGIGELTASLPLDDPRVVLLCRQCGERGLPVLAHCTGPGPGVYGLQDEVGSPRLESLLRQVPATTFIGHATGFWAEISGDLSPESKYLYPEGPIRSEGSLPRLLRAYPNLCADLSARSGLNAISRDREYGARFLEEFQDRLLFGTDVCFSGKAGEIPTLAYLRGLLAEGAIGRAAFEKITGANALRILRLEDAPS
jgi:hypothetical protein